MIRCILGLDPGLRHTGWGIVRQQGNALHFVAAGRFNPDPSLPMAERLRTLAEGIAKTVTQFTPDEAAIEETFVNRNPASALKLGQARGAAMLAVAQTGLSIAEYGANRIKQCVTGYGHADKTQVARMIEILLPGAGNLAADAADALAVAICHAHQSQKTPLGIALARAGG